MRKEIECLPGYNWIVLDAELLGGQPAVKGTRLTVSHILACLAEGMSVEEISQDYSGFPPESMPEILNFAVEQVNKFGPDAAA